MRKRISETFMLTQARRGGSLVLIISYEAFRSHPAILHKGSVGIIICDEVHFPFIFFSNNDEFHLICSGTSIKKC